MIIKRDFRRELEEKKAKKAEERRKMMSGFMSLGEKKEKEWRMGMRETNMRMEKEQEELKEKLAKEAEEREKVRERHELWEKKTFRDGRFW